MKYKQIITTLFIFINILSVCSAQTIGKPNNSHRRQVRSSGGLVYTKPEAKYICILKEKDAVSTDTLKSAIDKVIVHLHMPFDVEELEKKETLSDAIVRLRKKSKVGAMIGVVTNPRKDKWFYKDENSGIYIINVSILRKDANKDILAARLQKMIWRSVARTVNIDEGGGPSSVLDKAATLSELDAISATTPGPMQHNAMIDRLQKLDIKMIKVGTYRTACMQGWAPQPTNEVQRTIWNQVHQIPDKPITIEFDPKKNK